MEILAKQMIWSIRRHDKAEISHASLKQRTHTENVVSAAVHEEQMVTS